MELREERRENWGTRAGFVLAAIGSAVGLGNLWGFPYKLYSYGQGAFLIPYVIAMLLVGLPLMIVEFSLGHMSQRAAPDALRRLHKRAEFVGWWQIILGFIIITYYAVILAWCFNFLWYSVQGIAGGGELPWAAKGMAGVQKANSFFFNDYLHKGEGAALGAVQWPIIIGLLITWVSMYLCVFKGVRLVSKIVLWTVPLPWLMLLILTIRGLTLDGASQGLELYLEPNWSQLTKPETWRWAFGQTFFSMSLAFGVMVTYASFLHRKSDINNNAAIIGLADLGTSFIAGIAVFATLGGMAYASAMAGAPVPVKEVVGGGPSLAFVAFPYALAQLPYSAWFSLVFFIALLTLGLDSAFSITESVIAGIVDKTGWNRNWVVGGLHIVGLGLGIIYCTEGGLGWLGTMDDYINGPYGILLLGLLECLIVGWLYRLSRLRAHANERSDWRLGAWWDVLVRAVIPVVLTALMAWSIYESLANPSGFVRSYSADPVAVSMTLPETVGQGQVLQLKVDGKKETLDPAMPQADASKTQEEVQKALEDRAKALKQWTILRDGQEVTLDSIEGFGLADAAGQTLTYKAEGLTPSSKITPEFRLTADKYLGKEEYTKLASFVTNRKQAGYNTHNLVAVIIFALAPVAAIVFMFMRFRRTHMEGGQVESLPPSKSPAGLLSLLGGLVAAALAIWVFAPILGVKANSLVGKQADAGTVRLTWTLLAIGGAAGLLGLALGTGIVAGADRRGQRATLPSQFGGMLSAIGLGGIVGMSLALLTLVHEFKVVDVVRDQELSATSYVVMGIAFALIVGGLFWCFYKAFKGSANAEEQTSEA